MSLKLKKKKIWADDQAQLQQVSVLFPSAPVAVCIPPNPSHTPSSPGLLQPAGRSINQLSMFPGEKMLLLLPLPRQTLGRLLP